MRNSIISGFLLLFALSPILAQDDLNTLLRNKETLKEIMEVVDKYYEGKDDNWRGANGDDMKLKHWKRWEWYMSGRLGPKGKFVNIQDSLASAKKKVEKLFPESEMRNVINTWSSIGPTSTTAGIGRADRIAFHPSDPNIYYVGTPAGGLWKTTNGGSTWSPLTDHLPSIGISGIVVDWNNPSTIYILTGDGDSANLGGFVSDFGYARKSIGVLKSTDSGATWKPTGLTNPTDFLGFKLVQSPVNSSTLLAATSDGVYRTTNAGSSWTKTLNDDIYDLEFKPNTGTVYAASNDAIYFSLFSGSSWVSSTFDINPSSPKRIELAVTPANNQYVYALMGDADGPGVYDGTYRSTNSGISFELRNSTPNILGSSSDGSDDKEFSEYITSMAVSPIDEDIVVTGGVKIWASTNGGANPVKMNGYHGDIHELAYNPLNGKLYNCDDGGVYVSDDDGQTWTSYADGFCTSQIYHMKGTSLDDNYFLAGLQDNGLKLKSSLSTTWSHKNGADGFDVAFNPLDKTEFYAVINESVKRFWNSGSSSTDITPPGGDDGPEYEWFGRLTTHISNPNIVFVGYDSIQISNDKGATWTPVGTSGSWALETCPSNSNRLYAAGAFDYQNSSNGTLSRSDNLGVTWTSLENNTDFPHDTLFNKITAIAVNPGNSNSVYVTFGGFFDGVKVYRSADAGATWENYSGSLPNIPINAIKINAAADQVYIGTDLGVFYRHSNMNDWMPYNNKLPNVPVTDIHINENTDQIYISTFGRGAWENDLIDGCYDDLALGGNLIGFNFYQVNNELEATTSHNGGLGTQVFFKAGDRIILKPGFKAKSYTLFKAYIGGCGEGDIPE